jgi:hypothetical protein
VCAHFLLKGDGRHQQTRKICDITCESKKEYGALALQVGGSETQHKPAKVLGVLHWRQPILRETE